MAIALLGHVSVTNGTSASVNTTGATLFVAVNGAASAQVPTDNQTNTWTAVVNASGGGFGGNAQLSYVNNPTTSASHTFTSTGALSGLCVAWYSGTATSSPLDVSSSASTQQAGSITPTGNNYLIVAGSGGPYTAPLTIDLSFTIEDTINGVGGVSYGANLADLIQGTAAAVNPKWDDGGHAIGIALIASFKAATGGSATNWGPWVVGDRWNRLVQ